MCRLHAYLNCPIILFVYFQHLSAYSVNQPDDYKATLCDDTNEQSKNLNEDTFPKTIQNKAKCKQSSKSKRNKNCVTLRSEALNKFTEDVGSISRYSKNVHRSSMASLEDTLNPIFARNGNSNSSRRVRRWTEPASLTRIYDIKRFSSYVLNPEQEFINEMCKIWDLPPCQKRPKSIPLNQVDQPSYSHPTNTKHLTMQNDERLGTQKHKPPAPKPPKLAVDAHNCALIRQCGGPVGIAGCVLKFERNTFDHQTAEVKVSCSFPNEVGCYAMLKL